jgi:hypothetical protein
LQRWVSADPLTIHGLGADLNVYAYVGGSALKAIDPIGLEPVLAVLLQKAGLSKTDAQFATQVVHAVNPGLAVANSVVEGGKQSATQLKAGDVKGAVVTAVETSGVGAGPVVALAKQAVAVTRASKELVTRKGNDIKNLDTLASGALTGTAMAVGAAAGGVGVRAPGVKAPTGGRPPARATPTVASLEAIASEVKALLGSADDAAGGAGRGGRRLQPDPKAEGPHTSFKRDPQTGKVSGYAEWQPNPRNPSGFDQAKRVDVTGAPHFNKVTREDVATPHVQEKGVPGGVRPARPDEVPK